MTDGHEESYDRTRRPVSHEQADAEHGDGSEHENEHRAHVDHHGHETMFRRRFWVCLVLSIPVLYFSPFVQETVGYSAISFPGSAWITPIFAVIIFGYGGLPFLRMASVEAKNREPAMMMLISLAITVAFVYSIAAFFFLPGTTSFFWELVTLIDVMLLGHWLEMRSVRQASGALSELAKLMPDTAERIKEDGTTEEISTANLRGGDLILVRPGASIPADGVVEDGDSTADESMITGESRPIGKEPGDEVIGGTVNSGDGSLRVRITATGEETTLAGIMRLVEEAQGSKSRTQVLADRAAGWLFYIALAVAGVTAVAWILATGFDIAVVERVVTVLVIACPHALGLAVPLVVSINTSLAARNGVLVRDRIAMENARHLDTIIFDKTGTLTRGEQGVVGMETVDGWDDERALALTASVEGDSEHVIAQAIRRKAEETGAEIPDATGFEAIKGRGVRATVEGHELLVGGPNLLELADADLPTTLTEFVEQAGENGQTVVYLVSDSEVVAALALADVIREASKRAIDALHRMDIEVAMLTGDSEAVARFVADELAIDTSFAEVLPDEKDEKVVELQRQGKLVAMVGDGVNDAPALTRADVGIAIGSGTDVAIESADIVLVENDPLDVVKLVELSRASYRKMQENLVWATGYNVFALPLAAGILAPIGILLSPAVGAVFMSASTVIVAINAQRLRNADLSA
ncbi:heavy metal translocating P-type ATPase [Haladaptatus cibarius]|uniref:heavy metal translocating P-type ATPase n=1 Tax=Haladaptatus cibarius TaxID=453847 RepID=UPI000A05A4A6|nr:heavy metal translocating P-type ATPase [Haladaptatus cibarius]